MSRVFVAATTHLDLKGYGKVKEFAMPHLIVSISPGRAMRVPPEENCGSGTSLIMRLRELQTRRSTQERLDALRFHMQIITSFYL